MDILCAMHELGRSGQVTGTVEQLSRLCRCTAAEMSAALTELNSTNTASVSERNGMVTVINRRMQRELKERFAGTQRVRKHRGNGAVTEEKQKSNGASSVSVSDSVTNVTGGKTPSTIWDLGVPLLTRGGMKEPEARSLLGKMAKDHSRTALAEAIAKTSAVNPPDPKAYLVKVLQDIAKPKERGLVL